MPAIDCRVNSLLTLSDSEFLSTFRPSMLPPVNPPAPLPERDPAPATSPEAGNGDAPPLLFTSEELLRGQREILIRHAGAIYRLRVTQNGKLILNK